MDFTIPTVVAYVAAWLGLIGGVWSLFERAETVLRTEVRIHLSRWLTNRRTASAPDGPALFVAAFDRVFGEKHLSWKCFLRSSIASCIAVSIMFLIVSAFQPDAWSETYFAEESWSVGVGLFLLTTFFSNVVADYVSLLETRLVLGWIRGKPLVVQSLALIVDALVTTLIFGLFAAVGITVLHLFVGAGEKLSFQYLFHGTIENLIGLPEIFDSGFFFWRDREEAIFGVWLYPTYLTSIWVWMFFLGALGIKAVVALRKAIGLASKPFDVEEKPLRTLGFLWMLGITAVFILIPFV